MKCDSRVRFRDVRVCTCKDPDNRVLFDPADHDPGCPEGPVTEPSRIEQKLDALEAKTDERFRVFAHVLAAGDDRLEAKLDALTKALKSGAIGAWGNAK